MAFKGMFPTFAERHAKHIRPEVLALVARGNVTLEEWQSFRGNSYEFHLMYGVLDDEAFAYAFEYNVKNCAPPLTPPYITYDEALRGFFAPEILKRWRATFAAKASSDGAAGAYTEEEIEPSQPADALSISRAEAALILDFTTAEFSLTKEEQVVHDRLRAFVGREES